MLDSHDPTVLIARLADNYRSNTTNWEFILARQYGRCLPAPRTVVDVGCHEGAHAAQFLALRAERIVCFEPIPQLAERLREKFANEPAVVVHWVALGREERLASFFIDHEVPSESGLMVRQPARRNERIDVEMRRLDGFALSNVDFIKLDCEGAEIDVLDGATETLARSRPLMSIEYGASGYRAYGRAGPVRHACRTRTRPPCGALGNVRHLRPVRAVSGHVAAATANLVRQDISNADQRASRVDCVKIMSPTVRTRQRRLR